MDGCATAAHWRAPAMTARHDEQAQQRPKSDVLCNGEGGRAMSHHAALSPGRRAWIDYLPARCAIEAALSHLIQHASSHDYRSWRRTAIWCSTWDHSICTTAVLFYERSMVDARRKGIGNNSANVPVTMVYDI
jgi:hypothetical protein